MLRKTAHAGSFYPRFGEQISAKIKQWTANQPVAGDTENCLGLVVPHAGYTYSGECAARAYHYISKQEFDSLVILHPCHNAANFDWSVSAFEQYDTPLGQIDLDIQLYNLLTKTPAEPNKETRLHEAEHSMEIQLPLIKHFFPEALICPIMIGRPYPDIATNLAHKLIDAIAVSGKKVGIIVSTDLSHYHNADKAEKMDSLITQYIMSQDADGLWQSVISKRCEACGIGGVLTLLDYAKNFSDVRTKVLQYTHSGKVSGDNLQVVGYLSAVFFQSMAR
jgi:MEMO1 family protein